MKKKIIIGLAASALALGVATSVALTNRESVAALAADLVPDYNLPVSVAGKVFFNVSEFGPTDEAGDATEYSVYGYNNGTWGWLDVTVADPNNKVIYVECASTYTQFNVVRAKHGVKNTWPNASVDSYNETTSHTRSTGQNYMWIWGTGDGYGKSFTWHTIYDANLNVNSSPQGMYYNFNSNDQHYLTNVSLTEGDIVTLSMNGNTYKYSSLQNDAQGDCTGLFDTNANGDIVVKSTSLYEFYLKNNGTVWAQIDSDIEADNFAKDFLKDNVCDDGVTPPNTTIWGNYATRYYAMTQGAKNLFYNGASNPSGSNIEKVIARYEYVVSKYNTAKTKTYAEFIGRNVSYRSGASVEVWNQNAKQDSGMFVISLIAIAGLGTAAGFFFLRKKKEQ